ncbi:MAG: glycosyltransferase [Clostridia bacterium]|nr:glycosyltransferase [Clostridia bacterium]
MKVAHIAGKLKAGGVESVIFNYIAFTDRSDMSIDILYDSDSTVAPPTEAGWDNVRFIEIPPYQKLPSYTSALKRIFRENGYDIVHSHLNSLSAFPLRAAKSAGITIRIAHNHTTSSPEDGARDKIKRALRGLTVKYATHFAACSDNAARWMFGDERVNSAQVKIFPNAVDTEKFAYDERAREEIRAAEGMGSSFVLFHVGRFVKTKNHPFILDTFKELLKIRPDSHLILIGDGVEAAKALSDERGITSRVTVKGIVSDPEKYYSAADAFILPSFYEGLPVVALEAQASGLPCFFSDNVTRECAVTSGAKFIPLSSGCSEFARQIAECEARDRAADGNAVRASRFNIARSASAMKEYYREILDRSGEGELCDK